MPIAKIPIVHNFGIISRTHQEEIKQKILEKDVENRYRTPIPRSTPETSLNPRYCHLFVLSQLLILSQTIITILYYLH